MTAEQAKEKRKELLSLLKELRLKKGVTQVDISAKTGITQPAVTRIETGQPKISIDTLIRLADAIGVEIKLE
jgi:transcriptional regulator with XRE-family HTH domain